MMKKYSVALCGACALMMSSLVWSNDAAHGDAHKPEASKDAPAAATAAKADTSAAAKEIAQATKPARKKKGRAAKKAAQNAADAAPSAAAEQAKRIRVRQRGELASAVDAVQSGHASATEKHAADTHATTSNADHSQKTTTASVVSDGRASAVMEDRYMPVTKSVEAPAVEQSSYSLLDRHPAEYVKPAGEMASREAEPVASRAEPARVEAPAKIAVAETRPAVEPIAAAPASSPTPAAVAVREAMNNVQDSALACNPPLKSEVAALFDRWNASLRTGDPKKVVANYAPYSVLLPTVSNRARFTAAEKEDYFHHFLERKPEGKIDDRVIEVDCNSATDSGLYTFRFVDGTSVRARYSFSYKRVGNDWLISSHHSSGMPEQPPKVVVQAVEEKVVEKPAPKKVVERSENFQRPDGWVRFP
ncbi:MAG: hypothetical protein RI984_1770 [Pseudomonadota bacterium]